MNSPHDLEQIPQEFIHQLESAISCKVHHDLTTRLLYSTDASIYQIMPSGVVFPKTTDDLPVIIELASQFQVPVIPRGSGSGLAGQAIGPALILDTSRHLTGIVEINPEQQKVTVEPGVVLSSLNNTLKRYNLKFGPDPASADRATIGGSIGNNATGAHSLLYGMTVDNLHSAEAVLSDGTTAIFEPVSIEDAEQRAALHNSIETNLYQTALQIRGQKSDVIQHNWPNVWRRSSGYNLNYMLPWSPDQPLLWQQNGLGLPYPPIRTNEINLATLLAGSEGTLGILKQMTLRIVPRLKHTLLAVLTYNGIAEACDAVPELLSHQPSAVELVPGDLIQLARQIPAYARQLTFIEGSPAAMLVVEFSGESTSEIRAKADKLKEVSLIAETLQQQEQLWNVRKVGLGILNSRSGDIKPLTFIEDLSVPPESLGYFIREMEKICNAFETYASYYAHASVGCIHIRPLINIKTPAGVSALRSIAHQAIELTHSLGGAVSGEHGDGLARSEWLEQTFGKQITSLFHQLKETADPQNILNPGKIINPPPMDTNLRYGGNYQSDGWRTTLDFSNQGGLTGAIEMCNGAGVCLKNEGVMCPSFQVSREEIYSTRGRANLLRALISGKFPSSGSAENSVYKALDLCLACKGCKSECPSAVDVAKIKYELLDIYFKSHIRRIRDFLFGYIGVYASIASFFSSIINPMLTWSFIKKANQLLFGITSKRNLPSFAPHSEVKVFDSYKKQNTEADVLLLSDPFTRYFHPENECATIHALESAGLQVQVLPILGAGRTLISKGFLKAARKHASNLIETVQKCDPNGERPVVGIEPSEIYTLRDEYIDFFAQDQQITKIAKRTWMVDEYLVRPGSDGKTPIVNLKNNCKCSPKNQVVHLHGHCYQKAQPPAEDGCPVGIEATVCMLEALGYQVELIESGCCGMAGSFGYEAEHYAFSMQVGELQLFPYIRQLDQQDIVATVGTSCLSQITDGTGADAVHPIQLVAPSNS